MTSQDNTCAYHLAHEAEWRCAKCASKRCSKCVPAARSELWGPRGAVCHECNSILESLGKSRADIPPFWTQIGHFLRYVSTTSTFLLVIVLTGLMGLAAVIGILGVLPFIAAMTLMLRYHYAIIEHRAHGETQMPDLSSVFERDESALTLKTLGVSIIVVFATATIAGKISVWLGLAVGLFFLLAYPAMMIVLAMEKDMLAAVNPIVLLSFISKIGFPYLLLCLCYSVIVGGEVYLTPVLSVIFGELQAAVLTSFFSYYLFFASSVMLGYIVYEYQSELGHITHRHDDEELEEDAFDKRRALAETFMFIRDCKLQAAKDRLRPLLDRFPQDMELHDYYFRLLNLTNDKEAQIGLTNYIAEGYLKENRVSRAISYIDRTKKLYPNYCPEKPELAFELAQYLEQTGRYTDAASYLKHFHKRFPKSRVMGKAYLLLAKIYFERLNKTKDAKALLAFIKAKFKEHEEAQRAASYEQVIANHI